MKKIIILGIRNSGSTVLCQMLHRLGIDFGQLILRGKYGFTYENLKVGAVLYLHVNPERIDWTGLTACKEDVTKVMTDFFDRQAPKGSAIKHQFLCAGLTVLDDAILQDFTYINCTRPLAHCIEGAKRAYPKVAEFMPEYQTELRRGQRQIAERVRGFGGTILDWDYDAMSPDARQELQNICDFLELEIPPDRFENALSRYDESQRHFGHHVEQN